MKELMASILYAVALLFYSCPASFADKVAQDSMGGSPSSKEGPPERPYYLTGDEDVWKSFPYKAGSWFCCRPGRPASGTELQARILARLFPKEKDVLLNRVRQNRR
jgi:hypothetical protein